MRARVRRPRAAPAARAGRADRRRKNNRPGLEQQDWGGLEMTVHDPVGNRITFCERGVKSDQG
jgi:hypothetical protein